MSDFLKKLFGKDSILSVLQKIIAIMLIVIPAVFSLFATINNHFEKVNKKIDILEQKITKIYDYNITNLISNVNKQYWKIKNDPTDIKPMDFELVISIYENIDEIYKTPLLNEKMLAIRAYAMEYLTES